MEGGRKGEEEGGECNYNIHDSLVMSVIACLAQNYMYNVHT